MEATQIQIKFEKSEQKVFKEDNTVGPQLHLSQEANFNENQSNEE